MSSGEPFRRIWSRLQGDANVTRWKKDSCCGKDFEGKVNLKQHNTSPVVMENKYILTDFMLGILSRTCCITRRAIDCKKILELL